MKTSFFALLMIMVLVLPVEAVKFTVMGDSRAGANNSTYRNRLDSNLDHALAFGSEFIMENGDVCDTAS